MTYRKTSRTFWIIPLVLFIVFLATIHGFLARTAHVEGKILVVEAWFWDRPALFEVVEEYRRGHYEYVVVVGQPSFEKQNGKGCRNDADLAVIRLKGIGLSEDVIFSLTTPDVKKHKTFTSALVFSKWMQKECPEIKDINIFTIGVHARRSQLLFRRALGPRVHVGVIAGSHTAYVPWRWWSSFTGIKLVAKNLYGYLYALAFSP